MTECDLNQPSPVFLLLNEKSAPDVGLEQVIPNPDVHVDVLTRSKHHISVGFGPSRPANSLKDAELPACGFVCSLQNPDSENLRRGFLSLFFAFHADSCKQP